MKKLSELQKDTILTVKPSGEDMQIMSVAGFCDNLESGYYDEDDIRTITVTVADRWICEFSWEDVIENYADEMHEDWYDCVMPDLMQKFDMDEVEKIINEVFSENPTYYEGEVVDIEN